MGTGVDWRRVARLNNSSTKAVQIEDKQADIF